VPGRPHVYELVYSGEGADGRAFLPGLLDPNELADDDYDRKRPGLRAQRPGPTPERPCRGRPLAGPQPGGGRTAARVQNPAHSNDSRRLPHDSPRRALLEDATESYVVAGRNGASPTAP
jgi:hypothetical protein